MLNRLVMAAVLAAAADGRTPAPLLFMELEGAFVVHLPAWQARFSVTAIDLPGMAIEFEGASEEAALQGLEKQPAPVYRLMGRESATWRRRSAAYKALLYRELYPGIDLLYQARGEELKSEFRLSAGADPASIRLRYRGVQDLMVGPDGSLLGKTERGEFREQPPFVYQDGASGRVAIPSWFVQFSPDTIGFGIGEYRRDQPLVIDPVLTFSTYLGGILFDAATAVAADAAGNIVVAGWTESADFPANTRQTASGGGVDAFVAKFNAAGQLQFATYLGGRGEDRATGVAVDAAGSLWVTGFTTSTDFPLLSPHQSSLGGGRDAFLVKLNPAGTALQFSTYLGGSMHDLANAIAIDAAGSILIAGETNSANFPSLHAFQPVLGGRADAFVAKFYSAGTLAFSTFIGGAGNDQAYAVAVDPGGSAVLAGATDSTNFPVSAAAQPGPGGGQDAFVLKLSAAGNSALFSTYLGGSGGVDATPESAASVAINAAGEIYVAGTTSSSGLATSGAFQAAPPGGGIDGFLAKYSPMGTLLFRSYLGGSSVDRVWGVTTFGNSVIVVGHSGSPDLPLARPLQSRLAGDYDAFIARFNSSGTQMEFGTWLGGSASDAVLAVTATAGGSLYLAGQTQSSDFPLAAAIQTANPGNFGAFIAVLGPDPQPQTVSVTPTSGSGSSQAFQAVFSHANGYAALSTAELSIRGSGANICQIRYSLQANTLALLNDAQTYSGSVVPALPGSLENSRCAIDAAQSLAGGQGTTLTLRVSVSFKTAFTGDLLIAAADGAGNSSGWQKYGAWTATAPPPVMPSVISILPVNGSGASQVFTATYSDPQGAQSLVSAQLLVGGNGTANACYVRYERAPNAIYLVGNDGVTLGNALPVGTAGGILQNAQCQLDAEHSSASVAGNTLVLSVALTFKSAFAGAKPVSASADSTGGRSSGLVKLADFTVVPAPDPRPQTVSITPTAGSGSSHAFQAVFAHASGYAALAVVEFSLKGSGASICQVRYSLPTNTLALLNDSMTYSGSITPGLPGSLQNSRCAIDAASSWVTGQGTALTLQIFLSFKATFTGDLLITATDAAGNSTSWQKYGAFTATEPPPVLPSVVSISPLNGSGASQVFTATYADPQGIQNLLWAQVLIGGNAPAHACYVRYDRTANALYLAGDDGVTLSAGVPVGTAGGIVQNTQCLLDAGHSSASTAGNTLTLSVAITFKSKFGGAKWVSASADGSGGRTSGLVKLADFTVVPGPYHQPTIVATHPSSGSGSSVTLRVVFEDLNGSSDISRAHIMITGTTGGSCWVVYDRLTDVLFVVDDQGGDTGGSMTPGTNAYISSQQCWIEGMQSYVVTTPTLLVVTIQAGFKPSFAGEKSFRALVADSSGWATGWETIGTWTATGSVLMPPTPGTVTPAAGSGAEQVFTTSYSDPNGYEDMGWLHFLVTVGSEKNACYVLYDRRRNMIFLANELVSEVYGYLTPGVAGVLQNNQCLVDGAASAVTSAGTTVTLSLSLRFKTSFAGLRHIFTAANDTNDWSTGWRYRASWTIPPGTNQQPVIVSLSPNGGSGSSARLTAAFTDANGYQDIALGQILLTATPGAGSCYVTYDQAANLLGLMQDNGAWAIGAPGAAGKLENGRCSVNLATSSVQKFGPNLILAISFAFKPPFAGQKSVYVSVQDKAGWSTNWQVYGSWTVP